MSSIAAKRKLLVSDVMTPDPVTVPSGASIREAAAIMRDRNIGDLLVVDTDVLQGIVTDRDIVVRAVAVGRDPEHITVGEVASHSPVSLRADQHAMEAVDKMRKHSVHRLPVLENGRPIGIVSIGDLALRLEERGVLAAVFAGQHADDE
ncbi:MAG: CBS domain-containing protein [Thermoleophilia bacterium]|nr:CBS domain-containing protein [Thermoleophilia bacterium]